MNVKTNEIWVCNEPYCRAEIQVLKGAQSTCHGKFTLRCCCGKEMTLRESVKLPATPEREMVTAGTAKK